MIRIVRLGTPRAPDEGLRLGTVRRPPRGVPKAEWCHRSLLRDLLVAAGAKMRLMKAVSMLLAVLSLATCGPTKRFDQDRWGKEKVFAMWFRADVTHFRRVLPAPDRHSLARSSRQLRVPPLSGRAIDLS